MCLHEDRKPLTHVEDRDAKRTGRRRQRHNHEQGQEPRNSECATRQPARREQPEHADHARDDRPHRRRMLLPDRGGQCAQGFEQQRKPGEYLMCCDKQQVPGQDDRGEGQWHDDEGDDRNRHRVGERGYERDLLEQHQHQRNEAYGDRPLRARCGAKARARADATDTGVEEHPDRTKGQPESGREHRPRIPREHDRQRPQPPSTPSPGGRARARSPPPSACTACVGPAPGIRPAARRRMRPRRRQPRRLCAPAAPA